MKSKFANILVASFLSLCLSLPAEAELAIPTFHKTVEETFEIPDHLGWIKAAHPGGAKTIYLIKDAHASIEAQKNIAHMISFFVNEKGLKTVFEEGYEGSVPSDYFFKFIQDPNKKKRVSHYLLSKLRISGAEYAHINRTQDFQLAGADDVALHLKCLFWYRRAIAFQKEIRSDLDRMEKAVGETMAKNFQTSFLSWLNEKRNFEEGQSGLDFYLQEWIKLTDQENLKKDIAGLLDQINDSSKVPLNGSANWQMMKNWLEQMTQMENRWVEQTLQQADDRRAYRYYQTLNRLQRLNLLELSFEEYLEIENDLKLNTDKLAEFLAVYAERPQVFSKKWERFLKSARRFYEFARKREAAIDDVLRQFKSSDEQAAVLIYGGFHERGIRQILSQQGYQYFIIVPAMSSFTKQDDEVYRQAMRATGIKDAAPPERLFETALVQGNQSVLAEIQQWEAFAESHPDLEVSLWDRVSREETLRRSESRIREAFEKIGLTDHEISRLIEYTLQFLTSPERQPFFQQNFEELLLSLADPARLSIALRPKAQGEHQSHSEWIDNVFHVYSRFHRDYLNSMPREMRQKIYQAKLLGPHHEPLLRKFLRENLAGSEALSEPVRTILESLNPNLSITQQGFALEDIHDFSSGRGLDEGSIVNQISLRLKNETIRVFLKGFGTGRKGRGKKEERQSELFETFYYQLAGLLGLRTIQSGYFDNPADGAMLGYTLMEEIHGTDTSRLFNLTKGIAYQLKQPFHQYGHSLVEEWARLAALADLLNKGDRRIIQNEHPQYQANFMVDLDSLQDGKEAVVGIDHNWLFNPDNRSVTTDLQKKGSPEMGILAAMPEFYTETGREQLLELFEKAYLRQWHQIFAREDQIRGLTGETFGEQSYEAEVLNASFQRDPLSALEEQKTALLKFVASVRSETREGVPEESVARAEGLMLGIPVMDAGAEFHEGRIVYRNSLKKIGNVFPVLVEEWGMKEIYLYGGLFEMPGDQFSGTGINRQLHQVEYSEESRFLRSADGRVTIAISGYDTKREALGDLILRDEHGNPFSSTRKLNPHLSDSAESRGSYEKTENDLRQLIKKAHAAEVSIFVDFIPWVAPDAIHSGNIDQTFSRRLSPEELLHYRSLNSEAKQDFIEELLRRDVTFFAVEMGEGENAEVVLVKHLMSDFGTPNVDEAILNLFHPQAQQDYIDFLKGLIDLDVDGVRIDLGHVLLRKNLTGYMNAFGLPVPDHEPWQKIMDAVKAYAAAQGKSFKFIMEVYNDDDRAALQALGADVYYNHVFSDLYRIGKKDPYVKAWGLEGSLLAALKNKGFVIYPSNYDQTPLAHFHLSPAAILMLFSAVAEGRGDAGLRSFVAWRDALGMSGDVIPVPGGDRIKSDPNLEAESAHPHVRKMEELEIRTDIEKLKAAIPESPLARVQRDLQKIRQYGKPVPGTLDFTDNANRNRFFTLAWEVQDAGKSIWALLAIDPYGQEPSQSLDFIDLPVHLTEKQDPQTLEVFDTETGEIYPIQIRDIQGHRYVRIQNIGFNNVHKSYRLFVIQPKTPQTIIGDTIARSESRNEYSAGQVEAIVTNVKKSATLLMSASDALLLSDADKEVLLKMMLEHAKTSKWVIYDDHSNLDRDPFWETVRKLPNIFLTPYSADQAIARFGSRGSFAVHLSKGAKGKDPRLDFSGSERRDVKFARILDQPEMIALALLYAQNDGSIPGVVEQEDFLIAQTAFLDALQTHYLADLVISWSA